MTVEPEIPDLLIVFDDTLSDAEFESFNAQVHAAFGGLKVAVLDRGPKIYQLGTEIELLPVIEGESLVNLLAERLQTDSGDES